MLSPLQERVAHIVVGLAESDDFALAGGAALIVRGEVDRRTRDLDFFGPSAAAVDRLVPAAEQALISDGLRVERVIDHPGFARLLVSDGNDQTELDLGSDARLFPVEERLGLRVLSGEELAVDKLLALFGRAEARDSSTSSPSQGATGSANCSTSQRRRTEASTHACSRRCSTRSTGYRGRHSRSTRRGSTNSRSPSARGRSARSTTRVIKSESAASGATAVPISGSVDSGRRAGSSPLRILPTTDSPTGETPCEGSGEVLTFGPELADRAPMMVAPAG